MEDFIVTARKWRPARFEDVVGQNHITVTLRNAIEGKRIAHAYIFSGTRGVGKTTTARLLAKSVNCLHPVNANPDNDCEMCTEINENRSFNVIEIDGASNRGIDEIRSLRESVRYAPAKGSYKVYIIDEVHMLTNPAFNALLKTLEEPPKHVLFILATTEIHKLPATILSRCQRFDFRRLSTAEIAGNLRMIAGTEGVEFETEALQLIARKADGSLRDGQSLFDQMISLCGKHITHEQIMRELRIVDQQTFFRVTDAILQKDSRAVLEIVDEVMAQGFDLKEFLDGLIEHFRHLLVVRSTGLTTLIDGGEAVLERYRVEAGKFSVPDLLRLQRFVGNTQGGLRWTTHPRFRLEADFVQMVQLSSAEEAGRLIHKIDELKKKLSEDRNHEDRVMRTARDRPEPGPKHGEEHAQQANTLDQLSGQPLSEEELRAHWPKCVAEFKDRRISLGLGLEDAKVLSVRGNIVRLGLPDDFSVSRMQRHKREIQETLHRILNAQVQIEVEVTQGMNDQGKAVSPTEEKESVENHPVVKALIRELGAEPL